MAARKILVPYDFGKNEIQNAVLQVLASDPSGAVPGQMYYSSAVGRPLFRGASAFLDLTARANHTGTQAWSTITSTPTTVAGYGITADLATVVKAYRLDEFAAPTAAVSLNTQKITNLGTPTADSDAATKKYVDDSVAGLSWKDEVRVATTAAGTLASSFANGQVVDGITLVTGDRILIKDQSTGSQNGIYTVNASGAPTRALDANLASEIQGAAVYVSAGTTNGGTRWVNNNTGAITLDTTALTFVQFGGGATYTAGNGLTLSGNDFNVGAGTGISVGADTVGIDTSVVVRKFTGLIGNGAATSIAVTHSLGNQWVIAQVYEVATAAQVEVDIVATDANTTTFIFAAAPASNAYRVVIQG